eukprot:354622-Chlamydomonas_euryale.AAC.2
MDDLRAKTVPAGKATSELGTPKYAGSARHVWRGAGAWAGEVGRLMAVDGGWHAIKAHNRARMQRPVPYFLPSDAP